MAKKLESLMQELESASRYALACTADRDQTHPKTRLCNARNAVKGANGVVHGALYAERGDRPFMAAPGYKVVADYQPVTITVAE